MERVALADWARVPLVAVTVKGKLPLPPGDADVTMVSFVDPEPVMVWGENVAVAPLGRPAGAAKLTVPEKPLTGAIAIV